MKKLIFAALLLGSVSSFAHKNTPLVSFAVMKKDGVRIPASEVPSAVKATFRNLYPTATKVQWEREREDGRTIYQATFTLNGDRKRALFSANGTFLGQKS